MQQNRTKNTYNISTVSAKLQTCTVTGDKKANGQ